jgi:hypothetical protein
MTDSGNFGQRTPLTKAERAARAAFRKVEAEKALTDQELAEKAFHENRERLKAERLEREAVKALLER